MPEEHPWRDLTRRMDADLAVYADGAYRDPPFRVAPWSTVEAQGFAVFRLEMGSQTGTHIDAPSHFAAGGATLDALAAGDLVGRFHALRGSDLASEEATERALADYKGEAFLFVEAVGGVTISKAVLARLLALPPRLWVMAGDLGVDHPDPFLLNRSLAEAGKYLVEDLDEAASREIPDKGEMIVAPLRLMGVSGAPARVLAR